MTTTSYCSQCGAAQQGTANFCGRCGSRVAPTPMATLPIVQQPVATAALPWALPPPVVVDQPCYSCGRSWGVGRACQYCRQVGGLPSGIILSSPGKRLGAALLDTLLAIFTLAIGWLIWSLIIYKDGQTPGKQILSMRCAILETGRTAGWGRTFCREWLAKGLLFNVILSFTFGLGIVLYFWLLWDKDKQEIWDKVVGTIVVDDPEKLLQH